MNDALDNLFNKTKQDIKDILQTDVFNKIKKFAFKDIEYKFTNDAIVDLLPTLQAVNMGVLKTVEVNDVDGNIVTMSAEDFIERNKVGFNNKFAHELELAKLLKILDTIETFTALANFGSFEMAKQFYLTDSKENGI